MENLEVVVTVGSWIRILQSNQAGFVLLRISGVRKFKSLVLAIRLFLKAQAMMKRSAKKHTLHQETKLQTLGVAKCSFLATHLQKFTSTGNSSPPRTVELETVVFFRWVRKFGSTFCLPNSQSPRKLQHTPRAHPRQSP